MKILLAEHNPILGNIVATVLAKWGYVIAHARNVNEVWATLYEDDHPDLVILDWRMPGIDGVQLCHRIREHSEAAYVYIVTLVEQEHKDDISESIDAGADDYIVKPFDARQLKVRLRAGERILELKAKLAEAERQLQTQSTRDPISGVWREDVMADFLRAELNRARRYWTALSVIIVNLEGLDQLCATHSDQYAHLCRELVARLQHSCRSYDTLGKYGAHGYLLILPGCGPDHVQVVVRRITHSILSSPLTDSDQRPPLTLCIGVANTSRKLANDANLLLRAAESALTPSAGPA